MTSKPTVYWLGAADGIDDGAELGTVEGRLDCVGSRLGNTDGLAEMVGSRLGSDEGLSDGTGLGRPEGPNVGKGDDMARSNCDRIELNCIL